MDIALWVIGALATAQLILLVVAVTVLLHTPEERLRHAGRVVWLVIILVFNIVGPLAFLFLGRRRAGAPDAHPAPANDSAALLRELYDRRRP